MNTLRRHFVLVVAMSLALLATGVRAQNVVAVEISAQPLQYMKDGDVDGCGLRLIALRELTDGRMEASEISINLYSAGHALVKAMAYEAEAFRPGVTPSMRLVTVDSGWVRAPGSGATKPLGKAVTGEDGRSLVYVATLDPVLDVFLAQTSGKSLQMSVKRRGQNGEIILTGTATLSAAERAQHNECMRSLLGRIDAKSVKQ